MTDHSNVEIQTAQQIANNRSDKTDTFIILVALGWAVCSIFLYVFSSLSLLGSSLVAIALAALIATPLKFLHVRKRKAETAKQHQLQMKEHRAGKVSK